MVAAQSGGARQAEGVLGGPIAHVCCGTRFARHAIMANTARLETASPKQNRNLKVAQEKSTKRPPVKQLPPPDEDVLVFLPIG